MLLRALIHRHVARGRLRIGLRTRVRERGCYLGIPRNGAFQGFRPSENTRSLQGPILDNAEHGKLMRGVRAMTNSPRRTLRASLADTRRDDLPGEKPTTVALQ